MSRLKYAWWCFVLAAILGGHFGAFIYNFYPPAALLIGLVLFFLCFVILVNTYDIKEEEEPQHNRRFNDL